MWQQSMKSYIIMGRNEINMKVMEENLVAKVDLLQEQLDQLEVDNHHLQVEMKKSLKQVTKQLEKMMHGVKDEQDGDESDNYLKSVESFRCDRYSWEDLPDMHEARCWATAVTC